MFSVILFVHFRVLVFIYLFMNSYENFLLFCERREKHVNAATCMIIVCLSSGNSFARMSFYRGEFFIARKFYPRLATNPMYYTTCAQLSSVYKYIKQRIYRTHGSCIESFSIHETRYVPIFLFTFFFILYYLLFISFTV